MAKKNLKELTAEEIGEFVADSGLPAYRARQLLHWIYERRAESVMDITEFSKDLRAKLEAMAYISSLKTIKRLISGDGTEKYLFELEDGLTIESVLILDEDRVTLCISSQAGCAMGCAFCRTGTDGFKRNLKAFEIVDQIIAASRLIAPKTITNIVFMGMGEPMMNLAEVGEALNRITMLLKISKRRITVSTAGYVPGIVKFAETAPIVNLAISLNATTDAVRDRIMPINRKYPIKKLLDACREFPLPPTRKITFEYVMLAGVNDTEDDARRLIGLLRGIPSKVNLIPLNEHDGCEFKRPGDETISAFQKILIDGGVSAFIRKSKGVDISAACGQLRSAREAKKGAA